MIPLGILVLLLFGAVITGAVLGSKLADGRPAAESKDIELECTIEK